jgi:predicted DNA-binding transcriptional regulator AlpA
MDITENFLSEPKTAELLGVKVASLRNWSAARKGPPRTKIGRRLFYRRDSLVAWMEAQEKAVTPAPSRVARRPSRGR